MRSIYLIFSLLLTSVSTVFAQQGTHWSCDYTKYENDMTVYLAVTENNSISTNADKFEVAAFVGGECRGVSTTNTNGIFILRVWSNNSDEKVTFKVGVKNIDLVISDTTALSDVTFSTNATIGTPSVPHKLEIGSLKKYEEYIALQNALNVDMDDWSFTTTVITVDGLRYYLDETNKLAEFIGFNYQSSLKELNIPTFVNYNGTDYCVVAVINPNHYTQSNITSVKLPKALRSIGDYAFYKYTNLQYLEIPENVTTIGSSVFYYDNNLRSLKCNAIVPPTVGSFSGSSYKKMTIPTESFHAYRIASVWSDNILIGGDGVSVSTGNITAGELGRIVLEKAAYLQEVNKLTIDGGTLNSDDWTTIQNMTNLIEIDLSGVTVTALPSSAFNDKWAIEKIVLPHNLQTIGSSAFYKTGIKNIIIPESVATIEGYAFYNCDSLTNITIPSAVKTIPEYCFYDCASLKNIEFKEGLKNISVEAFYNCDSLKEVILPSSVLVCQGSPFDDCDGITKFESRAMIPPTTDGDYCPLGDIDLTNVTLYVPYWSVVEYQLANGWSSFVTVEPTDFLPQNIVVNKDFCFTLNDSLPANYRPNITMDYSTVQSVDAHEYTNYERGNLTISGSIKLPVNDFSIIVSPYAKYFADENVNDGYLYDYYQTPYNSTSLLVNSSMRAENVKMQLVNYKSRWQFVTFPFDVKVRDIVPVSESTSWVIRGHSGAMRAASKADSVWVNLTANDILEANKGYIMHCYNPDASDVWFNVSPMTTTVNRQKIFTSDDATIALEENIAEFDHNRSWNLIGNPYPCFYDTRFLDFSAPFMVWNSYTQNYVAYNPADDAYILSPGEAFFVQRPLDQESITFRKDGRQTDRYAREMEASAKTDIFTDKTNRILCNLAISHDRLFDRTRIVFNDKASTDYEMNCDAAKFASTEKTMPQIFTVAGNTRYAINERPIQSGDINLGVYCGSKGEYAINLAKEYPGKIILEDKEMNVFSELTINHGYSFNAKAGEHLERFVLHFQNGTTTIQDVNQNIDNNSDVIYNLQGIKVKTPKTNSLYIKNGQKTIIK